MRTRLLTLALAGPLLLGSASAACTAAPAPRTASPAPSAASGTSAAGTSAVPAPAASPCGLRKTPRPYRHVIWVWMENHSYGTIVGSAQAPYITAEQLLHLPRLGLASSAAAMTAAFGL